MTQAFPGFAAPAAGFDIPLEMLAACHLRIDSQLATLERLARHLRQHGADDAAREASRAVLRYFDSAAVHHHEDEEIDLFPALIEAMAGSDAVCIRELVAALTRDHRDLAARWQRLRPHLLRVADGSADGFPDDAAIAAFAGAYRGHLEREDRELLPMASRLLDGDSLGRIGGAMRRRRGIAEPDASAPGARR